MVLSFRLPKPNPDELSRSQRSGDPVHGVATQRKSRFYNNKKLYPQLYSLSSDLRLPSGALAGGRILFSVHSESSVRDLFLLIFSPPL